MKNLNSWNENIIDHVSKGIERKNISEYIGLLREGLNLEDADRYQNFFNAIEETSKTCKKGSCISKSLTYEKNNTHYLAVFHILKDSEELITVAYAVHSIAYNMQNGETETGLGDMEEYQRERAEERLKLLGFNVAYELRQLNRVLPDLEDTSPYKENSRDSSQPDDQMEARKVEIITIKEEMASLKRAQSLTKKKFNGILIAALIALFGIIVGYYMLYMLETKFQSINSSVITITKDAKNNTDQINTITKDVKNNTDRIDTITKNVKNNTDQINTTTKDVKNNTDQIVTITRDVKNNTDQIDAIRKNITDQINKR